MVRCVEFYDYWEDHPNFCGKERDSVRRIDSFVKLLKSLEKRGIERSAPMGAISERAARPLFAVKKESTYNAVVDIIAEHVRKAQKVSEGDIKAWIGVVESPSSPSPRTPTTPDKNPLAPAAEDPEDNKSLEECSCDWEPGPGLVPDPEDDTAYIKKLSFHALVCPTCLEVRSSMDDLDCCPNCGATLFHVIMRVERVVA